MGSLCVSETMKMRFLNLIFGFLNFTACNRIPSPIQIVNQIASEPKMWRLNSRGWFNEANSWNDCFYDDCFFLDKIRSWLDSNADTGPGMDNFGRYYSRPFYPTF